MRGGFQIAVIPTGRCLVQSLDGKDPQSDGQVRRIALVYRLQPAPAPKRGR